MPKKRKDKNRINKDKSDQNQASAQIIPNSPTAAITSSTSSASKSCVTDKAFMQFILRNVATPNRPTEDTYKQLRAFLEKYDINACYHSIDIQVMDIMGTRRMRRKFTFNNVTLLHLILIFKRELFAIIKQYNPDVTISCQCSAYHYNNKTSLELAFAKRVCSDYSETPLTKSDFGLENMGYFLSHGANPNIIIPFDELSLDVPLLFFVYIQPSV